MLVKAFEQQEDLLVSAEDKGALTAAPGAIRVEMPPQFPKGCPNSSSCCLKAAVERQHVTTLPRAVGANTGTGGQADKEGSIVKEWTMGLCSERGLASRKVSASPYLSCRISVVRRQ